MSTRDMTKAEFNAALKRNGFKLENLFIAHYVSRIELKSHQFETKIPCLYYSGGGIARRATIAYAVKRFWEIEDEEASAAKARALSSPVVSLSETGELHSNEGKR